LLSALIFTTMLMSSFIVSPIIIWFQLFESALIIPQHSIKLILTLYISIYKFIKCVQFFLLADDIKSLIKKITFHIITSESTYYHLSLWMGWIIWIDSMQHFGN
jgi:hypothetical protein